MDTTVRGTHSGSCPDCADLGLGVRATAADPEQAYPVELGRCLLVDNEFAGAAIFTHAVMDACVLRNTRPLARIGRFGAGVTVVGTGEFAPVVRLARTVIAGSNTAGVWVRGAEVTLADCMVRATGTSQPQAEVAMGVGVADGYEGNEPSRATLQRCVVEGSEGVGVAVASGSVVVADALAVRDTRSGSLTLAGDGLEVVAGAHLRLDRSVVTASARAGILIEDGFAEIRGSVLREALFGVDVEGTSTVGPGGDVVLGSDLVFNTLCCDASCGCDVTTGQGLAPAPIPDVEGLL